MLYQKIVDYLIGNIEKGMILPGEKLPSLRKISDQFDVSLSTAVEAYSRLELFGYVEARNRSGYFARLPITTDNILKPSKSFKSKVSKIEHIDEIIELMNQSSDKMSAPFGFGTPAQNHFPNKLINRQIVQTLKQHPEVSGTYIFGEGLLDLRQSLGKWIRPWVGVTPTENILITNGCLEALNLSLAAYCDVGDVVAIESPCYFGILHAINYHGLRALEVKTDPQKGLDPEALEGLAKSNKIKVLISNPNAQNPLGFTMSDERKKDILAICHRYNIKIIEDDLYGELSFEKKRPKSYKYFDKEGIVTYCSSFSKFLGPGLRLGWCIPPGDTEVFIRHKLSLNLATASLYQYAVARILKTENLLKYGQELADYYQKNLNIYSNVLTNQLGGKLSLSQPTGSYFLWGRIEGLNSTSAYQRAKKQKLSFTPGHLFSANKHYENYFRINCAHEFNEKRNEELTALAKILDS